MLTSYLAGGSLTGATSLAVNHEGDLELRWVEANPYGHGLLEKGFNISEHIREIVRTEIKAAATADYSPVDQLLRRNA